VRRRIRPTLIALSALLASNPVAAQRRVWQTDERFLVSDGGLLGAVAVSTRNVYAAAPGAILVYDILQSRWATPMPLPVQIAPLRVSALAWDPASGALWLGTENGDLVTVVPGFGQWDHAPAVLRGAVEAIVAFPRDGGVYVRSGGEWQRVRSGSLMAEPVGAVPPTVAAGAEAMPADPYFRAASGTLGIDPERRRWPLTDVAAGANPGEYWVATGGGGLLHFDSRLDRREWLRYGLAGRGAAAMARFGATIWFGGDGRGARTGVASASTDLSSWRQYDASEGAPRGFVAEIVSFGDRLWFASSDGLYRLDAAAGRDTWSRLTARDGLASESVRSLLVAGDFLWAGTDRGLSAFDANGKPEVGPLLPGRRVSRMVLRADTMIVGNDDGLWSLSISAAAAQTPLRRAAGAVRGRVLDLALLEDTLWVITDGGLYRVAGSSPGPLRDAALQRIGEPYRLAVAEGRLWVAGRRGIAHRDPVNGTWEAFTVPADIPPGPVVDVLAVGDDVWAATPGGAVRLRWR
jgi:hypothetical protein